jgi:uncharacterized coiled-coil DUF342 family protein
MNLLESIQNEVISQEEIGALRLEVKATVKRIEELRKKIKGMRDDFEEAKKGSEDMEMDFMKQMLCGLAETVVQNAERELKKLVDHQAEFMSLAEKIEKIYHHGNPEENA